MKRLWLRLTLLVVLAPVLALAIAAALEPLPRALAEHGDGGVRVLDRNGRVIGTVRAEGGLVAARVPLSEIAPEMVAALIAAEDSRFHVHPGIDPLAMLRAGGQAIAAGRIVSGASTLTQQLARNVVPRPRTARGKLRELAIALRIEWSLDKRQILEEYLNRVEFGPNLRGVEAASRRYFDKPAARLDLAEAATLAALPRGPTLYDPARGTERVRRRRDRILERMRDQGLADDDAVDRALAQPVTLQPGFVEGGAPHLASALARGVLDPELTEGAQQIQATLDLDLQREVETLTRHAAQQLADFDATSAAVLVVENASGDVLAYVGSPEFFDERAEGQNDGTRALRQPGSTLKPFVYATAMRELGMTGATLLPDVELQLPTPHGAYAPKNYNGRFHGPVRLREALASSLNVPAVHTAARVGPERVLATLHAVGIHSLDKDAAHYGAAVALGDGEVRLAELAQAYSVLARGGLRVPLRHALQVRRADGRVIASPSVAAERALDPRVAAVLTDILSDDAARAGSFGRAGVLELPFPVAAKTGTSKGFRDNWTIGFTREITVAVWVGNFDGRPMRGTSGITGAAPLFRNVMLAAMRGREPAPLVDRTGLVEVEVCALSGKRPDHRCPHRTHELFAASEVPAARCDLHVEVAVDPENGRLAGPGCKRPELRVFESYPASYGAWAVRAGRPLAPTEESPRCPGGAAHAPGGAPSIAFPFDGARFVLDPGLGREQQQLLFRARASSGERALRFVLDGRPLARVGAPFTAPWRLSPGEHVLHVETLAGSRSEPVRFVVR